MPLSSDLGLHRMRPPLALGIVATVTALVVLLSTAVIVRKLATSDAKYGYLFLSILAWFSGFVGTALLPFDIAFNGANLTAPVDALTWVPPSHRSSMRIYVLCSSQCLGP